MRIRIVIIGNGESDEGYVWGVQLLRYAANCVAIPFAKVGIKDQFGQIGSEVWLKVHYKLTAKDIVEAVQRI